MITNKALETNVKKLIAIKEEIALLSSTLEDLKSSEEQLKEKVLVGIGPKGGTYSYDKYKFSTVSGEILKIVDEEGLIEYCKTSHPDLLEEKIKRAQVLKAYKGGEAIPGVEVGMTEHLRVSINS